MAPSGGTPGMMAPMPKEPPSPTPPTDPLPLTFGLLFRRALFLKCPVCGGGRIFRHWLRMEDDCPTCGFHFERIEGHWIGSLAVNTVLTAFLVIASLVIGFALTFDDPSIPMLLAITVSIALFGPVFLFPFTRSFWGAFDLLARPLTPDDEVDPRYLPPPRAPW